MKKRTKKGFTLTELIVVLVIMSIIAAIAVPFFINYWRNAEFRKNESNARTVYLAAESKLTYYRSSGQWDAFEKQIKKQGTPARFADGTEHKADLEGRIYAITLDANSSKDEMEKSLVYQLIGDYTYDADMLSHAIAIEIDIKSGEVYSAFYGSKCKGLNYETNDADGYLTMQKRTYEERKKRLLGYYSAEDTVNVVDLKPTRLRITTINLLNSEKLSLNWSSNVGNNMDVAYEIQFYKNSDSSKLFSLTVAPYDMRSNGWSENTNGVQSTAVFEVKDKDGNTKGNWAFPVSYSDGKYSLVLDAMMSAKLQATIGSKSGPAKTDLERTISTSITRLAAVDSSLSAQQDIYATVKAVQYTGAGKTASTTEYRDSETVKSNEANTMYADGTKQNASSVMEAKVTAFRHLSNIRYADTNNAATFTLTNKNMDWTSVGTGVYDLEATQTRGTNDATVEKIAWKENNAKNELDFPSIPKFYSNFTLKGNGDKTLITHLKLGENSVIDDAEVSKITKAGEWVDKSHFLGLFCENEGKIQNVTLQNATVILGVDTKGAATYQAKQFTQMRGVGILAGRSSGDLENITIQSKAGKNDTDKTSVKVSMQAIGATGVYSNKKMAAVGGVTGVLEKEVGTGYGSLENSKIEGITMEGELDAILPKSLSDSDVISQVNGIGIGGIAGVAVVNDRKSDSFFSNCENHASVSGNMVTGGIVGKLVSNAKVQSQQDLESVADIRQSSNDGLILCTTDASDDSTKAEGHYFGGIVGYGSEMIVSSSTSASGRSQSYAYTKDDKDSLKGVYVGGIIGYGNQSVVNNCSTEKNGYILGSDYVGGIAGGFGNNTTTSIQTTGGTVRVTTNASYVIGKNYVGGIIGLNENTTVKNCINNGVSAGYERYVGGIVGYNASGATIEDCASYLSDYDNSVYRMIVGWEATADYAGGITGYNNGAITFSDASQAITVKSISSIVVGENYVGGIAGFNDINGTLDVHYTLIGGRIYGFGNCVGGGFGMNTSTNVLTKELVIKPRSVEGNYYVGGCIGANVVNLTQDVTMDRFRSDNLLGTIRGEAFCGGLIGYQRTYGDDQLTEENNSVRASIEAKMAEGSESRLLPDLSAESGKQNVPTSVMTSTNKNTFTITTKGNGATGLTVNTNNIPIQANLYVGGIVGYCERNSNLVIKDCKNAGNISRTFSTTDRTVDLISYVKSQEVSATVNATGTDDFQLHLVGGIIGANLENQVIDHCANTGSMSGYSGIGGVVGLNAGLVYKCELNDHFGNAALSYLGGIAGVNIGTSTSTKTYGTTVQYQAGTIQACKTDANRTISGNRSIGGIVGWNMTGGQLIENTSNANVTASGDYVGGIAGRNAGTIELSDDSNNVSRTVLGSASKGVGGIVGLNESGGKLQVTDNGSNGGEIVAVGSGMTVIGKDEVGGVIGISQNAIGDETQTWYLTSQARQVRAYNGAVGGIAGYTNKNIYKAVNRSEQVTSDAGKAGGILAETQKDQLVSDCKDYGNVTSNDGYAGGITAVNRGTIKNSQVQAEQKKNLLITSKGESESGVVCAVNEATGTITDSLPGSNITLKSDATIYGGITGQNNGIVTATANQTADNAANQTLSQMPMIDTARTGLTVGGAVGQNNGTVSGIQANLSFNDFQNYKYLGGIVGSNGCVKNPISEAEGTKPAQGAEVKDCSYTGTMKEKVNTSVAGNCYGGIVGINYAKVNQDNIGKITMDIYGVYTATSTSTAAQKEASSTHAAAVVGKNEAGAIISNCQIEENDTSKLTAQYGMLGAVTAFNKGTITMSGSAMTEDLMAGVGEEITEESTDVNQMTRNAESQKIQINKNYVNWSGTPNVENATYNSSNEKVAKNRMKMIMSQNGNIGGITAYNGTSGSVQKCVTGNWFVLNKSDAISVGTGGIIGMNESEQDNGWLINQAFVGRQLSSGDTNRFAGGIIGNQNNTTTGGWLLANCINYGTVYCYNSHYSGGILGQWTGTGGTIENCKNFAVLQTTYNAGWLGASSGIVAQLYHAYENNEYNVIKCLNYGSVYTRTGENWNGDAGANDSAGILGNITTTRVNDVNDGQKFKIQIIDCVNEPGVKIYSASMASGIIGFLSCDGADVVSNPTDSIYKSTSNVEIRVERCQNYASVLKGKWYGAGIFGDRYGWSAWTYNTVVKDCFSVGHSNMSGANGGSQYPIYSKGNGANGGNPGTMQIANRANDFFINANGDGQQYFMTNVQLSQNQAIAGRGSATSSQNAAGEQNKYAYGEYVMYDLTKNQYFVADIIAHVGDKTVDGANCYIASNGDIINKNDNQKRGSVLFYIENTTYNAAWVRNTLIVQPDNSFMQDAAQSWRRLEGIVAKENPSGSEKPYIITAPASATAEIKDGKINMTIAPANMPANAEGISKPSKCDPYEYIVKVSDSTGNSEECKLYTETGSFNIPTGLAGDLTVEVQAVSMYDDVSPSNFISAQVIQPEKVLPTPDARAELITSKNGTGATMYAYRISLNNKEEYANYAGWQVTVNVQGCGSVTLNASNPTRTLSVGNASIYQMVSKASATGYEDSAEVTVPTYLPSYKPSIALKNDNKVATPSVSVSGTTLDDLSITVSLDGSNTGMVETPPIYRVELIGTWGSGTNAKEDVVLAKKDTLTVAGGTSTTTFSNLSEYIGKASDLKIRIWYAESGLGPVYTYYDTDVTVANANITELINYEDGQETWGYTYSTVLANASNYFNNYIYNSSTLFTWLPAPVMDQESDTTLQPTIDPQTGELYYTFSWDKGQTQNQYKIELTGIDSDNRRIMIDTSDYTGGNSYKIRGEDWNYSKVEIKVTRLGNTTGTTPQIGLSTTATYNVAQRLERPAQPTVTIVDENELNYNISWSPISSETGCTGYDIMLREYDEQGTLGTPVTLANVGVDEKQSDGAYLKNVSLEAYAGKQVVIYLIAKADTSATTSYMDSTAGITYTLTVPNRLPAPNVSWEINWTYAQTSSVNAADFQNGALKASLTANDPGSVPPGGSAYLMKAYVYDSEQAARAATETNPGSYVAEYPGGNVPVQMDMTDSYNYYHNFQNLSIQYAGKWIRFYARISSGSGQVSSKWAVSANAYRLPYVKLAQPEITSQDEASVLKVKETDNPDVPGVEKDWNANRTVLKWDSSLSTDLYRLKLEGRVTDMSSTTGKVDVKDQIRIYEDLEHHTVTVQQYVYKDVNTDPEKQPDMQWVWEDITEVPKEYEKDTPETEIVHTYELNQYSVTIKDNFMNQSGAPIYYEMKLQAELDVVWKEDGGFSYSLKLPDVSTVTASDGTIVTHDDFSMTDKATFQADVQANETGTSDAYIASDEKEILWNN